MTLQEAKNIVAKKHGYETWTAVSFYAVDAMAETTKPPFAEEALNDEVAEVYARSKWDEACTVHNRRILHLTKLAYSDLPAKPEFRK